MFDDGVHVIAYRCCDLHQINTSDHLLRDEAMPYGMARHGFITPFLAEVFECAFAAARVIHKAVRDSLGIGSFKNRHQFIRNPDFGITFVGGRATWGIKVNVAQCEVNLLPQKQLASSINPGLPYPVVASFVLCIA